MKYAHYDIDGNIIGFYDNEIHEAIPSPKIEISEEQWNDLISNQGKYKIEQNELVLIPPLTIEQLRIQKIREFKNNASEELLKTDYKVIRHRDQVDGNLTLSLTNAQYQQLLKDRDNIRIKSNDLESQVDEATLDNIDSITW